jgi:hypothetical protein
MGRVEWAHRLGGRLDTRAARRLRLGSESFRSTFYRGLGAREGVDIAIDSRVVPALILLLAACDQAAEELEQADVAGDGLAGEIQPLSTRLRDVLGQDHLR